MREIDSTNNITIKLIRSLKQGKYRKETGLYVIEGARIIKEAMNHAQPKYIIYSKDYNGERFIDLGENSIITSNSIFESLCDTKSPQGIMAVMEMEKANYKIDEGIIVALEGVQNPLNVGTIIRTADALGASGVILSADCADIYSPKVLRGTMGSIYHIPVIHDKDFYKTLHNYKNKGFKIIAGDLYGGEMTKINGNIVMAVGNEGNGITDKLRGMCDMLWRINMPGKAESLNASVAAGIMLYTLIN